MTSHRAAPHSLSTPRLALRAPRPADARAMAELANDAGVARMTTSIPHPYDEDLAEAFIARIERCDAEREAVFAIATPADGFIGVVGFHPNEEGASEVGYWLGRPYWGQGYMTEAVGAALGWAGGVWGKRFVMSGHFADNPASGKVLIKAGFLYTGDIRPRFSIARGEIALTRMMVWLS